MAPFQCYPIDDPNAQWTYCPSYGAAIAFAALFGIVTVTHTIQAVIYRKPFALVMIMGGSWEIGGYVFRALSVRDQLNSSLFTAQQLLILLAPLWINAFVYMLLGRMIHFFLVEDRIYGIRARKITLMFVLFDITAFLVQGAGGSMTSSENTLDTQKLGIHIYMGGVGIQLAFILIFLVLAIRFQKLVKQQAQYNPIDQSHPLYAPTKTTNNAIFMLYTIYCVLFLIVFRNIYRLIEFSLGIFSSITTHEWFTYVFDSLPMLSAILIFCVFHPGKVLRGVNADFSEENKERKRVKKAAKDSKKEEKRNAEQEKKAAKRAAKEMQKMKKAHKKSKGLYEEVNLGEEL